ncbi:MAG: glycoside hydrolase family 31 protein [Polyangiaceae bacterium]|nr:glycoside hydrolase family 31 protein [Polyangiaceae bacterium]
MRFAGAALQTAILGVGCLALFSSGCRDEEENLPIVIKSSQTQLTISLSPFELSIRNKDGVEILTSSKGEGAYQTIAATVDTPYTLAKPLPGWDTYDANEGPWAGATEASIVELSQSSAKLNVRGEGVNFTFTASVEGERVHIAFEAGGEAEGAAPFNKTSIAWSLPDDERFYGLGERFASVNHRGFSLYTWAEEGSLGQGEKAPVGPQNPYPNGPSMTYFPVPFFLSSRGYGIHLTTTYRTETHFGSEGESAYRLAANADHLSFTVYTQGDPLKVIDAYTEDTGRPMIPAPWVFGPRRRVGVNALVNGVPESVAMRQNKIPVTGIDDAVHFLPALSHLGKESELATWTSGLHDLGYKAMCYNNPYVAKDNENAAADYQFGLDNGYFVKLPDGSPALTQFISGKLLTLATIDLSNPNAFTWFQSLLKRSLDLGYDGWMHDFGEYIPRDAVLFDGRRGDEFHNAFPVLSAKAAYELMEKERPGDYLFFVRSGGSGTQAYVPAVWGGDAEATFDETQGLPSTVRAGLNLSMSGVPYWGSDMTGFKCLTGDPNDKEVFLRWVEFGAVSPIMMEQNACSNPIEKKEKWKLWNDQETIDIYRKYALLHTRLAPYFEVLAREAHESGKPISIHPFLLYPSDVDAGAVEDAYYLGSGLYVSPVVRRGLTSKKTYLPPGRYVEWDTLSVDNGGAWVDTNVPLDKLPMWLVEGQIVPLLDPSIDTLAPATDPSVVTPQSVADVLDVRVALSTGQTASITLADGTVLTAARLESDQGNPAQLAQVSTLSETANCESCYFTDSPGNVERAAVTSALSTQSSVQVLDLSLEAKGPSARRIRWEVLRTGE